MAIADTKKMVKVYVNGIEVEVEEGSTILDATKKAQVKIPTLCYHPDLPAWGSCGICVVKVEGSQKMLRACATPVSEGMKIITHDPEIVKVRKTVLELILSNHPNDCLKCLRNGNCELQRLAGEFGIREVPYKQIIKDLPKDESTISLVLDPWKCVLCGRCANTCQLMQNVWALEFLGRGFMMRIAPAADVELNDSPCVKCGQCAVHCPVGAIYEKDDTAKVWEALNNPELYKVVQIAPAVRVSLGEAFGAEPGTLLTGKIYTALRRLGFDAVFDTNVGADCTTLEEAAEFVKRFRDKEGPLPLFTTCCPSWVDYLEKFYPEMIPYFSTTKSPHEMLGVLAKTYYAQKKGIDPKKIFMVSIMPCTSKKYETTRSEDMYANGSGNPDIDVVLTAREFARMLKMAGIDLLNLPESEPDSILGEYTGAGTIFGTTGGVMEAALRTAYYYMFGEEMPDYDIKYVRGLDDIKRAEIDFKGVKIRVAVAHELSNVQYVIEEVKRALEKGEEPPYHFVEVMACRGGCVGGGGLPYGTDDEVRRKRAEGLYKDDKMKKYRVAHQNPYLQQIYKEFLKHPLSEVSHKYLHNRYRPRPLYNL